MEQAWKSLLRNVTFFWLLSQGWALKKGRGGVESGVELIRRESYNSRQQQRQPVKEVPQKAYRFKGTLVVVGRQWCVTQANLG